MKRIASLALAIALALGSMGTAKADGIDIKVKGQWDFSFGWADNLEFRDSYIQRNGHSAGEKSRPNNKADNFQATHRVRTQVNFITSESLQAVLMFEIGNLNWGQAKKKYGQSSGADLDTDGVNIETRRAYLDWVIPGTEATVQMGLIGLTLPSTPMGSPLFNADVAGIVASTPVTDWLSASLFWARPFDYDYNNGTSSRHLSDETDVFGLLLPMNFANYGISFTPYFMWGRVGTSSGAYEYLFAATKAKLYNTGSQDREYADHAQAWWLGAHLELTALDSLVFNIEGIYGNLSRANLHGFADYNGTTPGSTWPGSMDIKAQGWIVAATLDYNLDFMTPGIFGWYGSGDGKNATKDGNIGRMPVLGNNGGSFGPTSFGSAGYYGVTQFSNCGTIVGTGTGTWGLGIQLADFSFVEDLKHTLRIAYYRGTNSADNIHNRSNYLQYSADRFYLTDKDYVWEVNFDHQYKIYENLTAVLELGWLRMHTDKDTWARSNSYDLKENDNAYKAQIAFKYSF